MGSYRPVYNFPRPNEHYILIGVFFYYNKNACIMQNNIYIFFHSFIICCREIPLSKLDSVGLVSVILKVQLLYTFVHACEEDEALVGHESYVYVVEIKELLKWKNQIEANW